MFFINLMSVGFISAVDAFIYLSNLYHCCLIYLFLLFCIINFNEELMKILFSFSMLSILGVSLVYIISSDYLYNYNDAYNVIQILKEKMLDGGKILCTYDDFCSEIISYLDNNYKFIALNGEREYTYALRDSNRIYPFLINFDKYIYKDKVDYIVYPYLANSTFTDNFNKLVEGGDLEIEYESSDDVITDEKYIIYKVVK